MTTAWAVFASGTWPAVRAGLAVLARWMLPMTGLVLGLVLLLLIRSGLEERQARAAARDRSTAELAVAADRTAVAAQAAAADLAERQADRDTLTRETRDDILSAPGARVDAGPSGAAGLRGLCRRPSYRDHPRCAGLRPADSAAAPR